MNTTKYIVTGGPGTGKTTLINHLGLLDYDTKEDVARKVIELNLKNGGKILPWINRNYFDNHILNIMRHDYNEVEQDKTYFYDGCALDIIAWRKYLKLEIKSYLPILREFKFKSKVFIPEPWKEIYYNNDSRPFKFEQSIEITNTIKDFYEEQGFHIISIPKLTPMERANFVINSL